MPTEDVDIRSVVTASGVTRYDLVLLTVPVALGLAFLATTLFAVPQELAVGAGSAVAAAAVGDGLFRHPPQSPPPA